jgi:hypothetical protein
MATGDYKITTGSATANSTTINAEIGGYITTTTGTGDCWIQPNGYPSYPDWNKHSFPSPPQEYPHFPDNSSELAEIKKELKKLKKKLQNKEIPMKSLYNVVVVSIDEKIVLNETVVANDENEATFNAGVHQTLVDKSLKPKDVTIVCTVVSSSIRVRKEPQKVIMDKE